MKVCVYGAGAIGGHVAARLATAGAQVSVVARGEHGRAIAARGITLLRGEERVVANVPCAEDPAVFGPQDVVVVAVKGPALPTVAARLPALLKPATRVVFAMNGIPWWFSDGAAIELPPALVERLDPEARLRDALAPEQVVGCAIYSGNAVVAPGVIRNTTPQRNRMVLGRPDGDSDTGIDAFADLARRAGYDCVVTDAIRQEIWIKMQIIVAGSPVSTLTRAAFAEMVSDPGMRGVTAALMREAAALGARLGLAVPDDIEARLDFYRTLNLKPSMLQDLESGRALEYENGIDAFREIAAHAGVAVPTMDVVGALLAGLAQVHARAIAASAKLS